MKMKASMEILAGDVVHIAAMYENQLRGMEN